MKKIIFIVLILIFICPGAAAESSVESDILEKSGAQEIYYGLDDETKELLDDADAGDGTLSDFDLEGLLASLSEKLRESLAAPVKALAAVSAAAVLCGLMSVFSKGELGGLCAYAGAFAAAAALMLPLAELLSSVKGVVSAASAFLLSAVPVYAGLILASGMPSTSNSYSFICLFAGNLISVLSSGLVFPLLRLFLAMGLVSSVSSLKLDKLLKSVYGLARWLLSISAAVFSALLSVSAALGSHTDAAAVKLGKLAVSAAIPIVGSAFGDAAGAILNSLSLVRSGVGAFGLLAVICIFAPCLIRCVLWSLICFLGGLVSSLFEAPGLASLLSCCLSFSKMLTGVLIAVMIVCVACAAILIFAKG